MASILLIETATPVCSVALARGNEIISQRSSQEINIHSTILTVFIQEVLKEARLKPTELDAIAVSKGPGSYTGLRIGVSVAKGLCYALDIPLISVNTLLSMAGGMKEKCQYKNFEPIFYCPMIDARRMEVYSAVYDHNLTRIRETKAEIIDENSFSEYLFSNKIIFFGNGAAKCKNVLSHSNALFVEDFEPSAIFMKPFAEEKFLEKHFEDVAYFEPFYLKDFIAGVPKVKGLK
ncbi:MAG: tRNA (adenosine(37)-N6)-threonylcarbamoyltransferase complex dimerization subunit type 1 TsaB [Bacteroidales bacterium]|nr:tRNA (adenosine(37)-N6)-threonylcarbamoyltransferase complex dimerization subunit type 1 TsaB [Bacteroidales bacterium]